MDAGEGLTEAEVANRLKVSQPAVHCYRRLQRMPKPVIMAKIEKLTAGQVTRDA
jgi:predicted transcriptional regulator